MTDTALIEPPEEDPVPVDLYDEADIPEQGDEPEPILEEVRTILTETEIDVDTLDIPDPDPVPVEAYSDADGDDGPPPPDDDDDLPRWLRPPPNLPVPATPATNAPAPPLVAPVQRDANRKFKWDKERLGAQLDVIDTELRLNQRCDRVEVLFPEHRDPRGRTAPPCAHVWQEMTDPLEGRLIDELQALQDAPWPRGHLEVATQAHLADHSEDTFITDFLFALPDWDKTPRLDSLLYTYFEVLPDQDAEYVAWAGRQPIMLAVTRAMEEHWKGDDKMVVLVGPQGCGKTSYVRDLLPEQAERLGWFGPGISLRFDGTATTENRFIENTLGKVMIECDEVGNMAKSELNHLKSMLARPSDVTRLAYRKNARSYPRLWAAVATANPGDVLPNDPTGNRRFAPVSVRPRAQGMYEMAEGERWQVWAEAKHRYFQGERANMPPTLYQVQSAAAEDHRVNDAEVEELVAEYVQGKPWVRLPDVKSHLRGDDPDYVQRKRPEKALQHLGYHPVKKRVEGHSHPIRIWEKR